MSFSARKLLAIAFAIVTFAVSLCAQSQNKQTTKIAGGSVSGRVTVKEKAAIGVVVSLRKSDSMPFESFPRATTDQDGVYRITNVSAGTYEVVPAAPGFVLADQKESRSKSVLVGEDENVESINFSLVRGGVITGRITDADGRPVIQQQVGIYLATTFDQTTNPPRPPMASSNVQTDDRGIYRAYGLAAGRYKVATGRGEDAFGVMGPTRFVYKQVFYPDATEQAKATAIDVTEGSESANIDIVLGRALPTFSVSGRAVDGEKGLPVPNLRFGVQRTMGSRLDFVNVMANSNAQGDFIMEGLTSGKYSLFIWPNQGNEMRAETLSFDVIDQDISGIIVKVSKGASISGVVVLDTEEKSVSAKLSELLVRGFVMGPTGTGGMGSSAASPIAADGSFRLAGLPGGTANFTVGAQNSPFPPKGFTLTRIERDGVAASGRGFEIKEGEQVTGVRLVLSYGNASIRGVVKLENGSLPDGARIFVRVTKVGETSSNLRSPTVDLRGFFLMEGIPAGAYEITANVVGAINAPIRPRSTKREVMLQDGVVTDVTITVDMGEPQKP